MKHIYLVIFSLVLLSCGKSEKSSDSSAETVLEQASITVSKSQFETENMQLGMLTEQTFDEIVKVTGFTDVPPQNRASVSTLMSGYIKKTPLLVGDKVKKGQYLVTLENIEFVEIQQQYLEVAQQLGYLKTEYERQETLFNEQISSQKNFLKAESTYKSTLALYNGLRKKLEMMKINPSSVEKGLISSTINIYAPIKGFITKVNVNTGSFVSRADEILEIVNTDHLHLELSVFEKDILKIKKGQVINYQLPEASDSVFSADVHLVGTSVNDTSRTIKVHGHIHDEEQTNLVTGMFVDANIITSTKKGFVLPKDAVVKIENDFFALVLIDQKDAIFSFNKMKLNIGKQSEEYIEVLNVDDIRDKKILLKGPFMVME